MNILGDLVLRLSGQVDAINLGLCPIVPRLCDGYRCAQPILRADGTLSVVSKVAD
jgi:hypothetical protein